MRKKLQKAGAVWGMIGIVLLIAYSLYRLGGRTLEAFGYELTAVHWIVLVVWGVYMLYSEGVKGFGQSFSPRAAARAQYIAKQGKWHQILLAPIFCFGFYQTTRRRLLVTYILTAGIIGFIMVLRLIGQPWRGVIDFGVVLGLTYGLGTIIYFSYQAWRQPKYIVDPAVTQRQPATGPMVGAEGYQGGV